MKNKAPDDELNKDFLIITIDGPSGVGKGTIAKALSASLDLHLLDSGSIYRLAGLASIKAGVRPSDISAMEHLCRNLDIEFVDDGRQTLAVMLDGRDVTAEIRDETIAKRASEIAVIGAVRNALMQRQRDFAQPPGLVADGRDMGTVVFPQAQAKFFLTADAKVRAGRRYKQLLPTNPDIELSAILRDIQSRDRRDAQRAVAPLKPASDAIAIDTSNLNVEQVLSIIRQTLISTGVMS